VRVLGVEASEDKVDALLNGVCPINEPGVPETLRESLESGLLRVSTSLQADGLPPIILICVGTPNLPDGACDLRAVHRVLASLDELAADLPAGGTMVDVVLRSTVPPGTIRAMRDGFPRLAAHARLCIYPEFLREGSAMRDFMEPPQTIVGLCSDDQRPEGLLSLLARLGFAPKLVKAEVAELVKSASNAFHAIKVAFANEIGRLSAATGSDGTEVMRLLTQDTVLNISARYLMPGVPFGGSCLPKDTRMLAALGRSKSVDVSLLEACGCSNQGHVRYIVDELLRSNPRCVAVLGIAFKEGTDDLRESAGVTLIRELLAKGVRVQAHDFAVCPDRLFGVNKREWDGLFDGRGAVFCATTDRVVEGADAIVRMHANPGYDAFKRPGRAHWLDVRAWRDIAR
jgi:GDP-mannose 6-dehydrogenase